MESSNPETNRKLSNVVMLAMDFDGVHTDGFVYVDEDGKEMVRCSRRDGLGLAMLQRAGLKLYVISKEENQVVAARCRKLKITCVQAVHSGEGKKTILERIIAENNFVPAEVAYIGDDLNDKEAMEYAGISIAVADAHPEIMSCADIILTRRGGDHALRELSEMLLTAKKLPLEW